MTHAPSLTEDDAWVEPTHKPGGKMKRSFRTSTGFYYFHTPFPLTRNTQRTYSNNNTILNCVQQ